MSPMEFRRLLDAGRGGALLEIARDRASFHREVLLQACLKDGSYDPQIEGSKATYLFEAVELAGISADLGQFLLLNAPTVQTGWDARQFIHLCLIYSSKTGSQEHLATAKRKFIECLEANDEVGAEEFVEVCGADGFAFVAREYGKKLDGSDGYWNDGCLYRALVERLGESNAELTFAEMSSKDPLIGRYKAEVEKAYLNENPKILAQEPVGDYQELEEKLGALDAGSLGRGLSRWANAWGQAAQVASLTKAAQNLVGMSSGAKAEFLLKIFAPGERRVPFPDAAETLIRFAGSENIRIRCAALRAMSGTSDPLIHGYITAELLAGRDEPELIEGLASSYQKGDLEIIKGLLQMGAGNPDVLHGLSSEIRRVASFNPGVEFVPVLEVLYDQEPCGICRTATVELFQKIDKIPDWIAKECAFDSRFELRALVGSQRPQ